MQPPLPKDALERAQSTLVLLHEQLQPLFERLPAGTEFAVQFKVEEASE